MAQAKPRPREHRVSIAINGREIGNWLEYQIDTSLIEPADSFSLSRAFDLDAWRLCHRDAYVKVMIDGQARASGFVDVRRKKSSAGTMEITGRDRVGRLVQESAPRSAYGGTSTLAVLQALAEPWFQEVVLSNAKNRRVTLGKGSKVPSDSEAISLLRGTRSKKQTDAISAMFAKTKNNRIDLGQTRFNVMKLIASRAGLAIWSSADGKTLFVGKPDQVQPATFMFRHGRQSNVIDLEYEESNADRYSSYTAVGAGSSSELDFGASACSHTATVYDNPANPSDGTGRDFLFPKRLVVAEQALRDHDEAQRAAELEQRRREFSRTTATVTSWYHGQIINGSVRTLYALDTMARVIDEDIEHDEDYLIYAASFRASRDVGEQTTLHMVPRGTEIVL